MSDKTIQSRVIEVIADQLGIEPEEVLPESKIIEDLGADSLDMIEIVMAIEEEFDCEIADEEAEKIKTVGDVIKLIEEKAK